MSSKNFRLFWARYLQGTVVVSRWYQRGCVGAGSPAFPKSLHTNRLRKNPAHLI